MGHVRDLPKKKLGVDVQKDFEPTYEVIPDKKKLVAELKKAAKGCDKIILAADPDREGEAICWHLGQLVGGKDKEVSRAVFHEITRPAILAAFGKTVALDMNLINAQQTRRILDRLMGYLISPLLWTKITRGLSAGRVQSVALRLICDREKERDAFKADEYWNIAARLQAENPPAFKAALAKVDGKKADVVNGEQAAGIVDECNRSPFILDKITVKEKRKTPSPPYITSTLQQEAYRVLKSPVKRTMSIAQKLYEGMDLGREIGQVGLITYMRTDSVQVSEVAVAGARKYIEETYGADFVPAKPYSFKSGKKAQEAHEAIRPTRFDMPPDKAAAFLKREELSVYKLIWNRFMASQMAQAVIEETEYDIKAGRCLFRTKGEVVKFEGFLALSRAMETTGPAEDAADDAESNEATINAPANLPRVREGETLTLLKMESEQKFTQPPARFTEGTLVKELESRGIGRPSTYAPIIATIQGRTYVSKEENKFKPTDLGICVTEFLVEHFPTLLEYEFTARMEEELDQISEGARDWKESLRAYYAVLDKYLKAGKEIDNVNKTGTPTDEKCPNCGSPVVIKIGRYGKFKSCTNYPECKFRESLVKKEVKVLEEKCPQCGSAMVQRFGRFGPFVACSNYPTCKYIKKDNPDTGIVCPKPDCGGKILRRRTKRGKNFFGCSNYPKCDFASWDEPLKQACPKCGAPVLFSKFSKSGSYVYCGREDCGYRDPAAEAPAEKMTAKKQATAKATAKTAEATAKTAEKKIAGKKAAAETGSAQPGPEKTQTVEAKTQMVEVKTQTVEAAPVGTTPDKTAPVEVKPAGTAPAAATPAKDEKGDN